MSHSVPSSITETLSVPSLLQSQCAHYPEPAYVSLVDKMSALTHGRTFVQWLGSHEDGVESGVNNHLSGTHKPEMFGIGPTRVDFMSDKNFSLGQAALKHYLFI